MKKLFSAVILLLALDVSAARSQAIGELPPFTDWYQNPLGISPLKLHTSNAFTLGAIAVAACLLLTEKDTALTDRLSFFQEAGVAYGYNSPYTTTYLADVGLVYHPRTWLAIGAELHVYHFRDRINDTWGIGARPFARWYPVSGEDFRLYFECGAGIIWNVGEFPRADGSFGDNRIGTHLNGTPKYGIGTELSLDDRTSVIAGVRHVHISNGNLYGAERNPGYDGNGFYLGFSYRPRGE